MHSQTGTCALFFASQGGYLEVVRELVTHGAPVDLPSYVSVVHMSSHSSACLPVSFLNESTDCIVLQDGGTPFFVACQCNHLEVAVFLLENGADVNTQLVDGAGVLFITSQNGHHRMVQYLLSKGADPSMKRNVSGGVLQLL